MTFVAARIFRSEMKIYGDTMVTERDAARQNIVPGVCKVVPLHRNLCIAFAGRIAPALGAIRRQWDSLTDEANLSGVLDDLRSVSAAREVDFIVASRDKSLTLHKVHDGKIAEGLDRYWIGEATAASKLQELQDEHLEALNAPHNRPNTAKMTADEVAESTFTHGYQQLVHRMHVRGVGGVVTSVIGYLTTKSGNPGGFFFNNHAGAYLHDYTQRFSYSVSSTMWYGMPIFGVFVGGETLKQTDGPGFIYSPIDSDEPAAIGATNLSPLSAMVHDRSRILREAVLAGGRRTAASHPDD